MRTLPNGSRIFLLSSRDTARRRRSPNPDGVLPAPPAPFSSPASHCAGCLTCVRVCPFGVARVEKTAVMPAQQCQTCGLCAAECPAAGIALSRFATNGMKDTLGAILSKSDAAKIARPFVVSYCCLNETTSRKFLREQTEEEIRQSGILRVMIPCVSRLSTIDLLSPFELGADKVAVIACTENGCFYPGLKNCSQSASTGPRSFWTRLEWGGTTCSFSKRKAAQRNAGPGYGKNSARLGRKL